MNKEIDIQKKFLAEAVGTFIIVFSGCGSIMVAERFPSSLSPSLVPVVFGLAVAAMVYALGHLSGAHFNPAVTLGFAAVRHFPVKQILPYWAAQISGGVLASLLLGVLLPPGSSFGATFPHVNPLQAVLWEMILTFLLMFVIIAVATDTRAVGTMAGAAIGAAVMLAAFVGGPVTGASMNPARSLGPAILEGKLGVMWIYILGPFLGAISAAFFYEKIRCSTDIPSIKKKVKGCC